MAVALGGFIARIAVGLLVLSQGVRAEERPQYPSDSAVGEALAFLKSMPREWSGFSDHDCHTYDDKNLERLKPTFILASAAFLKAFMQTHGAVTIHSAHRSLDEQYCVCIGEKGPCAGKDLPPRKPGKQPVTQALSRHQLGIAMDVRPGAGTEREFICLHEFARANPQFGVHFPIGRADYPHMELVGAPTLTSIISSAHAATGKVKPCQKMKVMLTYDHLD